MSDHDAIPARAPTPPGAAAAHVSGADWLTLDALGIDEVCARIESGQSQADIARDVGVAKAALCFWLRSDPERSARAGDAATWSAEAWLDRGLEAIEKTLIRDDGSRDVNAARNYAQECARRAAIRNPAYRDRAEVQVTTDPAAAAPAQQMLAAAAQLAAQAGLSALLLQALGQQPGRVIEADPQPAISQAPVDKPVDK